MEPTNKRAHETEGLEPALAEFAQVFVRRIPDDYLATLPEDHLFAELRSVFDFMESRDPGVTAIRVFDPERPRHGYETSGTVVDIVVDDSPFLIDSIKTAIELRGWRVSLDAHVVLAVQRDPRGRLVDLGHARHAEKRESIQHYVLDRHLGPEQARELEGVIEKVLHDVSVAVRDFEPMRDGAIARMIELARGGETRYGEETVAEAIEFLEWLRDLNFVFLGYREYVVTEVEGTTCILADPGSGLGILSDLAGSRFSTPVPLADLPESLQERYREGFLVVVAKTNSLSTVHRHARMDYVGVRVVDEDGSVVGEARLLGLFTSRALMSQPESIPILSGKLARVLDAEDLIEGSHDYRSVVRLFNSLPQPDLWSMPVEAIKSAIEGLLAVESREQVRLFVSPDLLNRSVSVMVVLPRDRFNPTLRQRLETHLIETFNAASADYQLTLGADGTARIHFTVWTEGPVDDVPFEELQRTVVQMSRSWDDRVREVLGTLVDHPVDLLQRWSPVLPDYYKTSTSLPVAARDILQLEALASSGEALRVGIQNEEEQEGLTRIAVYTADGKLELSEILPLLEASGLHVVEEVPTRVGLDGADMFIHDVGVLDGSGAMLDIGRCGTRLVASIEAGLRGETEPDQLDRLLTLTDLTHQQVGTLRAYRIYRRRVGSGYTDRYINDTLVAHPHLSELFVALFERRFDPAWEGRGWEDIEAEILKSLDAVVTLEEDRILRGFFEMILATVRTNAYKPGRDSLSLKIWSAAVPDMPDPKPLFEVFVLAPHVEGIHLRGGKVARGGIRWSDRREDYRSEVLGLMKAQMTKNALIVPTGAKGAFVLRKLADRADNAASMREAYQTFIRGLLDVTDNLVAGEIAAPSDVRRHDPDDPYLVVAADRGTASLSDTANRIASSYGFWLQDAFASGGSQGYDHKALGITARGAWESVRRHFADLSIDADIHPISVVGIGDMSGDVFGNGMLQSQHLRLIAAFDHRDIFIDPEPVPGPAHTERKRLFQRPHSSWQDYDRSLISPGGGVWSREVKRIDLSDEMRRALGTGDASLTPDDMVSAILKAPVDLLWNGGIGTYVKASDESHASCLDRANDAVRVDAADLRCSVVVEGGNLGFTQVGRVEFALGGGRINTDFIDNSGGVDCSDREVNLKILLGIAEESGALDPTERGELVFDATEDVVAKVLEDNRDQALILSQDEEWAKSNLDAYESLMRALESDSLLDRQQEALPGSEEMIARGREGLGLTRPELAVLLAYAKQDLKGSLIASDAPDDPDLLGELMDYFPERVSGRFADLLWDHPLRREILATVLASQVVNDQGVTFVSRLAMERGSKPERVVAAYRAARRLIGADQRWETVQDLDPTLDPGLRRQMLEAIDWLVEAVTGWYLTGSRTIPNSEELAEDRDSFAELESFLGDPRWADWTEDTGEVAALTDAGISAALARRHARHDELVHGPDIIELARDHDRSVSEVGQLFMLIGASYRLDWLEHKLGEIATSSRWHKAAVRAIQSDLIELRRELAEKILSAGVGLSPEEALESYRLERLERHESLDLFMQSITQEDAMSLDPLMVAARQIRALGS